MSARLPVARNIAKAWLLVAALCGPLAGVGWLLGGYRLLSLLVFAGLLLAAWVYVYAERIPLGMLRARELPLAEAPALHSMLERLAVRARLSKPRLYVLADGPPRALATGRGPRAAGIAVSRTLLSACSPAELEGVLAHELAHIRYRDVLVQSAAVIGAVSLLELSRLGGFLQRGLLYLVGPLAAGLVHLLVSYKREYLADRFAAELCESPDGLADALVRLDRAAELVWFEASPATEPLYTVNPFAEEGLAGMFGTHPPIDERVRRLRALANGPSALRAA